MLKLTVNDLRVIKSERKAGKRNEGCMKSLCSKKKEGYECLRMF